MTKTTDPAQEGQDGIFKTIGQLSDFTGDKTRTLPPVNDWNPPFCGDLDIEIKRDGTWFYMGTPIGRHSMVQLFSSVLRKDEDDHTYLVTPVEKVRIKVTDAHFVGVELIIHENEHGQVIAFKTNVGEVIEIGKDHPIWFEVAGAQDELKPYFAVRDRLFGLVNRATMYELIELSEELEVDGQLVLAIRSGGEVFPIMAMAELNAQIGAE